MGLGLLRVLSDGQVSLNDSRVVLIHLKDPCFSHILDAIIWPVSNGACAQIIFMLMLMLMTCNL